MRKYIDPKVHIRIKNKGKDRYIIDFASRIKRRLNTSLVKDIKLGHFSNLSIKVFYGVSNGENVWNIKHCENYSDLRWAINAFLDKDLYIQKLG